MSRKYYSKMLFLCNLVHYAATIPFSLHLVYVFSLSLSTYSLSPSSSFLSPLISSPPSTLLSCSFSISLAFLIGEKKLHMLPFLFISVRFKSNFTMFSLTDVESTLLYVHTSADLSCKEALAARLKKKHKQPLHSQSIDTRNLL